MKEYRIDGFRITFATYAEACKFVKQFNKKYINNILNDEIEMLDTDDIKEMYFFETAEEAMEWSSQPDWFEAQEKK